LDDILENSFLRKDIPAAHTVYGVASTISAAMYAIFISLQRALVTNQPEMIKLYTEMMLESWRGRGIEIYWRDNYICPSEEEYLEMVERSKCRVRAMIRI
jgi:geranylgeranyl diphosphate synthase type 3